MIISLLSIMLNIPWSLKYRNMCKIIITKAILLIDYLYQPVSKYLWWSLKIIKDLMLTRLLIGKWMFIWICCISNPPRFSLFWSSHLKNHYPTFWELLNTDSSLLIIFSFIHLNIARWYLFILFIQLSSCLFSKQHPKKKMLL